MGKTTDHASLFRSTSEAANQSTMQQAKLQRKINKAKHRFIWWAGIMFTLFPVLVSFILGLIVESTQDSSQALKNYGNFILGFFTGGSFLWLSITLLGISLLELFLFGFKKNIDSEEKFNYIKLIVCSIGVGIIAIIIYVVNIGSPIKATTMIIISAVSFLLFAKSSHIVSFKLVQEV